MKLYLFSQAVSRYCTCVDPGIFVRGWGVQVSLTKKSSDNVFFFFCFFFVLFFVFLVLSLFYRSQMVNFKEIHHFSRFQRGSDIFQGVQLFPGGSNCLFLIETHITSDFPGGGPDTLSPPSGSALAARYILVTPPHTHTHKGISIFRVNYIFKNVTLKILFFCF